MNIQYNCQLQAYNSFRTKAVAKIFAQPTNIDELVRVLKQYPNEKKLILGNGCNLFFTKDFDGLVIKPMLMGISILSQNEEYVEIEVGAAEDWDELVEYCVSRNWAGIENLSHIPGSVGAAPIQNIGAYGTEVKNVVKEVNAINIDTGEIELFDNNGCDFSYRDSFFKKTRKYVITSVVMRLSKSFTYIERYIDLKNELANIATPNIQQVRNAIINIRKRKLPNHLELPNAGSFFKNPIITLEDKNKLLAILPNAPIYNVDENHYKTSAAYLIEQAGYKGKRNGDIGAYEKHSLIIVNYGSDCGQDIANFMYEIKDVVEANYGIRLEAEVWMF